MYIVVKNGRLFLENVDLIANYKNSIYPNNDLIFETIKLLNGEFYNLPYHQKRLDYTLSNLFGIKNSIKIEDTLKKSNYPKQGLYRTKIVFSKNKIKSINFYPYVKKNIKNFILVESNIDYRYKFLDRSLIDNIKSRFLKFDEIIITNNGYLQDTSIANIALFSTKLQEWHTPIEPILEGTTLKRYLKEKKLIKKMIHYKDLKNYSKIATLNAMVDFNIIKG